MITKIIMDGGTSNHDFKLHTFYSPDSFFILARHDFLNVTNTKLTGIQSGGVKDFLRNLNDVSHFLKKDAKNFLRKRSAYES